MCYNFALVNTPPPPLLAGLNTEQALAVTTTNGPLLIVAGAGSGKTRALTHRIAYLIQEKHVSPCKILAVTFTNKAAKEMKERAEKLLGNTQNVQGAENVQSNERSDPANAVVEQVSVANDQTSKRSERSIVGLPTIGTFHSVCVQILRRDIHHLGRENSFVIYDTADQKTIMRQIFEELSIDPKQFNPAAILSGISWAKNRLITPEQYTPGSQFEERVADIYPRYQKALLANNGVDFDDILILTVELFKKFPEVLDRYQERWHYISIDEYQDTNIAQAELTNLLASKYRNLCVIGDPDQSIYSWRGAEVQNIRDFKKKYPETKEIKLEQNYRSTSIILEAANAAIRHNKHREEKKLWTTRGGGEKIYRLTLPDERMEAEFIVREIEKAVRTQENRKYADYVILYRTNAQSRVLEEVLLRHGLPHRVVGGVKFYERKEIKDLVSYLRLIVNSADSLALTRIINVPLRSVGPKTIEAMQVWSREQGAPLITALEHATELPVPASKQEILLKFYQLILELQDLNREATASEIIRRILEKTRLKEFWALEGKIEGETRYENAMELVNVASKYDNLEPGLSLTTFLEEIALLSDADQLIGDERNVVTLMTLHAAKGLEFPVVFLAGLEQNIFPHSRSLLDHTQMEEERRLFYVGLTRAMDTLYLLSADQRMFFGETHTNAPSEFLEYIPPELIASPANVELKRRGYDEQPLPDENAGSMSLPEFTLGDRVRHASFGEGVITAITGGVVEIRFDHPTVGRKKLALSIAPLEKI